MPIYVGGGVGEQRNTIFLWKPYTEMERAHGPWVLSIHGGERLKQSSTVLRLPPLSLHRTQYEQSRDESFWLFCYLCLQEVKSVYKNRGSLLCSWYNVKRNVSFPWAVIVVLCWTPSRGSHMWQDRTKCPEVWAAFWGGLWYHCFFLGHGPFLAFLHPLP